MHGADDVPAAVTPAGLLEPPDVAATAPEALGRDSARRVAVGIALVALGVLLLVLLVSIAAHDIVANSDSATVALEGRSIGQGNVTLSGWSLSLDSFWTIDALFYAGVIAVLGFTSSIVQVVPGLIGALVIALGAFAAGERLSIRGRVVAAGVVVVMLGLPDHALAAFFLQGPWHIGTALWCLIAFVALRRGGFGWGFVVAVVFLAAGLLGDLQALGMGVIPVALGGVFASGRRRSVRAGLPAMVAAVAAVLLAVVVRKITSALGAFSFNESHHTASFAQMVSNLAHLASWTLALLGVVRGPFGGAANSFPIEIAHLLGAVLVLAAVLATVWTTVVGVVRGRADERGSWRLDDLLLLGCLGDLAMFEVLALSKNPSYARYLTPALIFAILLGARWAGRLSEQLRAGALRRVALVLLAACTGAFAAGVAVDLRRPAATQPVAPVDAFLLAHHLTNGIGDYWAASVVTLESHGAVTIRPVVANASGTIVRDGRQSDSSWYAGQRFEFLVYQRAPYGRVDAATVRSTFGSPATTYTIGKYYVLVWPHLLQLPPGEFPS